ncbi:class D sortase [Aquisalibacillus elongatus]|uniref:Sortase A n=1 Tax=Aquisalibacillus elongatus TaxID=485577 RepID=A0A3N5BFH5_9BACI|nr:class D sortase [Aquisalibacillus elongatus]RPF54030.1 sortase A [Aquisalibacillus elongatus]
MKKVIPILFALIGIGFILFPHIQKEIYATQEQELIQEFRELDEVFTSHQQRSEIEVSGDDPNQGEPQDSSVEPGVVGLMEISKIDLTLPMLKGATEENLNVGLGVMEEADPLGENGNTGIAGHRGYKHGRLFNRLDEIVPGDEIKIETLENELTYIVFDTKIVTPDDVSVLESNDEESIITLITCEPIHDPTHRIIVQAKKVNNNEAS